MSSIKSLTGICLIFLNECHDFTSSELSFNSSECHGDKADEAQTGVDWRVGTILNKVMKMASLRRWHLSKDVGSQISHL